MENGILQAPLGSSLHIANWHEPLAVRLNESSQRECEKYHQ